MNNDFYNEIEKSTVNVNDAIRRFLNDFKLYYELYKETKDFKLYDNLLFNLLKVLSTLIMRKDYNEISIIFDELKYSLCNPTIIHDELKDEQIYNFQFIIGIILCLIQFTNKETLENDKVEEIILWTRKYFVSFSLDIVCITSNFNKYYNMSSSIQKFYEENFDKLYEKIVLREIILIYSLISIPLDDNILLINTVDIFSINNVLNTFDSIKQTKLEKILNIDEDKINRLKIALAPLNMKE